LPLGFLRTAISFQSAAARVKGPARQGVLPYVLRKQRREAQFKLILASATILLAVLILAATATGRYLAQTVVSRTQALARRLIGLPPDRKLVEADWARRRQFDIASAQASHARSFLEYSAEQRRLLDYAGLEPERALVRWGNFNKTVLLPATVFLPDDNGRSYKFRPGVRSVWIRDFPMKGVMKAFFQVVDTPRARELARLAGVSIVPGSEQTTNSWGLRGPEPDQHAQLRGIVLGDSYMQGLFVDDANTPTELLKKDLAERMNMKVEILNTGCLGYSPEQYYYTLRAFADRFPPRFVVVSVFANDVGDLFEALEGKGDWDEAAYWLDMIRQFCFSRRILHLVVPAPWVNQMEGSVRSGYYPGLIANQLSGVGTEYLDPMPDFANALVEIQVKALREQAPLVGNPLFNGRIGDGHFSVQGSRVWARAVGRRLALLLQIQSLREPSASGPARAPVRDLRQSDR